MRQQPSLDDSSQLALLRDRVRSLEKELLGVRGHADVSKSKADRGAAREEYLMAELLRLSEQLQCKFFRVVAQFLGCAYWHCVLLFVRVLQVLTLLPGRRRSVL